MVGLSKLIICSCLSLLLSFSVTATWKMDNTYLQQAFDNDVIYRNTAMKNDRNCRKANDYIRFTYRNSLSFANGQDGCKLEKEIGSAHTCAFSCYIRRSLNINQSVTVSNQILDSLKNNDWFYDD